jgi:hypothetical protein
MALVEFAVRYDTPPTALWPLPSLLVRISAAATVLSTAAAVLSAAAAVLSAASRMNLSAAIWLAAAAVWLAAAAVLSAWLPRRRMSVSATVPAAAAAGLTWRWLTFRLGCPLTFFQSQQPSGLFSFLQQKSQQKFKFGPLLHFTLFFEGHK